MGKEHFPVRIEELSPDMGEVQVTLNRDRAKVVGSPNYDDDEAPAPNVQRTMLTYYGYAT